MLVLYCSLLLLQIHDDLLGLWFLYLFVSLLLLLRKLHYYYCHYYITAASRYCHFFSSFCVARVLFVSICLLICHIYTSLMLGYLDIGYLDRSCSRLEMGFSAWWCHCCRHLNWTQSIELGLLLYLFLYLFLFFTFFFRCVSFLCNCSVFFPRY